MCHLGRQTSLHLKGVNTFAGKGCLAFRRAKFVLLGLSRKTASSKVRLEALL